MIRWAGTAAYMTGMVMTAMNVYPLNLFFGALGGVLWTIVGLKWKDRALIVVEVASALIYIFGVARWLYTVSQ